MEHHGASPGPSGLVAFAVACYTFVGVFSGMVVANDLLLLAAWLAGGFVVQIIVANKELDHGELLGGNVFCFFQGASLCLGLIPDWPGVVVGIIVGLAVAILAMKFMREVMIVSSALSGGFNAANGLLTLFSVTAGWPLWVLGILLTAAGIFVQWTTTGDRKDGTSL